MLITGLKSNVKLFVCAMGFAGLLITLMAATAIARPPITLLSDYNTYIDSGKTTNIYGNVGSGDSFFLHGFTADLEYAVYQNEAFGKSFPNQYIYAYQIFNHQADPDPNYDPMDPSNEFDYYSSPIDSGGGMISGIINYFSIATTPNTSITYGDANGSYYVAGSGNALFNWSLNVDPENPNGSITANFIDNGQDILPGGQSAIVYFTSPYGPTRDQATLTGDASGNIMTISQQPFTPTPEPATWILLSIGAFSVLLVRSVRHK